MRPMQHPILTMLRSLQIPALTRVRMAQTHRVRQNLTGANYPMVTASHLLIINLLYRGNLVLTKLQTYAMRPLMLRMRL
jgi:hypothetical protein